MHFVLVHGGWCWARVARLLRAKGHNVWTPTLTALGERSHLLRADLTTEMGVQDVMAVLKAEELNQVVLIGHSSGGVTISGVADRMREREGALIYLNGLIIHDGESLATNFTPPQAAAYVVALAQSAASFPPPAALFDVPNGPDADWVNRRLTPQAFGTATNTLRLGQPVGSGIPSAYMPAWRHRILSLGLPMSG